MDYKKLSRIIDTTPRKGDFISGKTKGGLSASGRLVEENESGYLVKSDNKTFYTITKESAVNKDFNDRLKTSKDNKIAYFQSRIDLLESELDRVSLDMEQDPEVLNDPDNGDNPAVIEYGEKMTKIQNKIDAYKARINELR